MFVENSTGFDDLGQYSECLELTNHRYVLLKGSYQNSVQVLLGVCSPLSCNKLLIQQSLENLLTENSYDLFPSDKF